MSQKAYETYKVLKDVPSLRTLRNKSLQLAEKQQGYLKNIVSKHKVNNLVSGFIQKMKKKNIAKPSSSFEFQLWESQQQIDNRRFFKAKGFNFPQWFQAIVLALDIVFCIVILAISTFQTLIQDFRNNYSTTPTIITLKVLSIIIFALRIILLMFNIQYKTDIIYEYVSDIIVKQFLDSSLIIHPLCLIMVILSLFIKDNLAFDIIFLLSVILKFFILGQDIDFLELIFLTSTKRYYLWNLCKVLVFNIIFAHILVIILLAIKFIDNDRNWITVKLVGSNYISADLPWHELYMWTYYWACTIMMTVGFGDITAVTYREAITIAFIQIFSVLILAYNINVVGSVVNAMKQPKIQLERKLGIIHRMKRKNPIPRQLLGKIQNYLIHQIEMKDNFQYQQHRQIIEALPQQLRNEYYQSANQIVFENLPFFWHLQSNTLLKISLAFKGKVYYPSQYFIKRSLNPINDVMIVRSGTVALQYWKPKSKLNRNTVQSIEIQSPQKPFEITNFINKFFEINYNIVAETYCYSLNIKKDTFVDILRESNLDYYYYSSIMDKHERDLSFYYYTKCQYCSTENNQYFHTKFLCPKLHFTYQKQNVILTHLHKDSQIVKRKQSKRMILKAHGYKYRNNQFKAIENQNTIHKAILQTFYKIWDCDIAYNYHNYFNAYNVTELQGLSLKTKNKFNITKLQQQKMPIMISHQQNRGQYQKNKGQDEKADTDRKFINWTLYQR